MNKERGREVAGERWRADKRASGIYQESVKGGELGDRELLGAGVRAELKCGKGLADDVGRGDGPQIVH
jgi:hypothetical protein